jgi:hypothetical protein
MTCTLDLYTDYLINCQGVLHLVSSDTTLTQNQMAAIY